MGGGGHSNVSVQLEENDFINREKTQMEQTFQEEVASPVGQGLKSCIHVARVSNIFHPCQAYKYEQKQEASSRLYPRKPNFQTKLGF